MAEIPVKKSSGVPLWVWALAAVILLALVWWLFTAFNDEPEIAAVAPAVVPASAPSAAAPATESGPITELSMLSGASLGAMTGREVRLSSVPVLSVVGDRTFFIGTSEQDRVFVVLDEQPTPGPTEGRYDVTAGQQIALVGSVQPTSQIPGIIEGLPASTDAVVRAQRLEILNPA